MKLAEAIRATAELCGTKLSEPAADLLLTDLEAYPEPAVVAALARCRRELKGRLTLAEIISRIDDGRPGPDEAWAMLPWNEETTAILTEEMQLAQGAAWHAYQAGDVVGARLAFREAYAARVADARAMQKPVDWQVSLGWDREGREGPIREAVAAGRLSPGRAMRFLPHVTEPELLLLARQTAKMLPAFGGDEEEPV